MSNTNSQRDAVIQRLHNIEDAANLCGCISPWTLRKHIANGTVRVTRIGRRVFLPSEEIERIRREGLPSLRAETIGKITPTTNLNSKEENQESCLTNPAL
jgi:hypothetical protein